MDYGNPGSDSDYFSDGAPAAQEGGGEPEAKSDGQTAILPKSILAGKDFKVGEEVVLKIVAMHENDVEVEYASSEEGGGEESYSEPTETATAPTGESSMASMME